jgi:aspartyl-tRNA synthetase
MMTSLNDPIVEAYKITLAADPSVVRKFVSAFMDSAEGATFQANPDGPPGVFVYDPRKPLEGLQAFGFEGLASLKNHFRNISGEHYNGNIYPELSFEDSLVEGDLIILQARPNVAHSGGSTSLGRFRTAIHKAAVAAGLKKFDPSHKFLWVTDFPLFTLNNETDPGQGGAAGFSATHHPFTAPKKIEDVDLMFTDPLKAKADHYDLVVNGVELGGGSRRIHNSEVQQFVMRNVLKVSEERLRDFSHLFEALRAGCPPHAGIAFGLDRLVAIMSGKESVRDVIAFPKSGKGEDLMVKSPTLMTMEQLATYHLEVKN